MMLLGAQLAAAVTQIDHCDSTPITTPKQYHVIQDLAAPLGSICLLVQSDNVELHLDGHTITSWAGIFVSFSSNVSIVGTARCEHPRSGSSSSVGRTMRT